MKPLKGSRTEANLMAAFAGETQARTKYTYYASQAKKDGYVQISKIFEETAANEKEHAKIWFKLLHGGAMPATTENLKDAAAGEHFEWTDMYQEFAEQAREEGFDQIAALFEAVGKIEKTRRTLSQAACQCRGRICVLERRRYHLGMCKLRTHSHRKTSSGSLSGLQSSAVVFSGESRELLNGIFILNIRKRLPVQQQAAFFRKTERDGFH